MNQTTWAKYFANGTKAIRAWMKFPIQADKYRDWEKIRWNAQHAAV